MLKDAEGLPGRGALRRLLLAAGAMLICGCAASTGTVVKDVWSDSARTDGGTLGKTLVVALGPQPVVSTTLETEWVRQLRSKGIDAHALQDFLPERPPDERRVVALVREAGFNTLLVSRLVDVKDVERDVSTYQVGVVDTSLYAASTETKFWSVRADTFLLNPTAARVEAHRQQRARDFVEAVIRAMSRAELL